MGPLSIQQRALGGESVSPADAPIVLVLGDAVPLVEATAHDIVQDGIARCGIPAFNHARYSAPEGVMDAVGTANTPPMMSDLRVVEVRDLHQAKPDGLEALVEYAGNPLGSTRLVLVGHKLPPSTKGQANWGIRLRNAVKKVGLVIEHKASSVNLPRFASDVAKEAGKYLSPQDAAVLVEWLGSDLGRIRSEVQKLALFVGDRRPITADDIREGSALLGEAEIWALTGAITARDVDAALTATHRLVASGEDSRRLLAMVVWQLREIVKVSEWVGQGLTDRQIRERGRIRWDVVKAVRQAGPNAPQAARTLSRLARANRAMNQHRAGDVRILEELVLELCR